MDDLLAIKYVSYEKNAAEILIWNWKLGALLNRIECFGTSCTFGFLTPNSLMLFHSNALRDDSAVRLSIYVDIRTPISPQKDEPPICTTSKHKAMTPRFELDFPTPPSSSTILLLLRAEPAPTVTSSNSATFVPDTSTRIIQLGMTVIQGRRHGRTLYYQIFISKEKLLQHLVLPEAHPDLGQEESPIKIPWESWGEYTTRWFANASAVSPWICRAYGTRFVRSTPIDSDDEEAGPLECISLLDFHPPTVRRFSALSCDQDSSMWDSPEARRHIDLDSSLNDKLRVADALQRAQTAPGPSDRVFVDTIDEDVPSTTKFNGDTIVTRLPYRMVTRVKPVPTHSGWMIDNDRIIGMPVSTIGFRINLADLY